MTQIKFFGSLSLSRAETQVNNFLEKNKDSIEFIDLKQLNDDGYYFCLVYKVK